MIKEFFSEPRYCRFCQIEIPWSLTIHEFVNGSRNFSWHCSSCGTQTPGDPQKPYIDQRKIHALLTPEQIDLLPLRKQLRTERCAVCGDRDSEVHHWAPAYLFGDEAERWPKDHLCKSCHHRWHRIVTPDMSQS